MIVGRKGTVGSVYWEEDDFYPIDTVFYVSLKRPCSLYWIYLQLKSIDIQSLGADSAVPSVNRNAIHSQYWTVPSEDVLVNFNKLAFDSLHAIKIRQKETAMLIKTRDRLLPRLLSGELPVSSKISG